MAEDKKSVNIILHDGENNNNENEYKEYIIKNNIHLTIENKNLLKEINEKNQVIDDLEKENERYDESKRYEKGLMHNLYEMKNKSQEQIKLYEEQINIKNKLSDNINNFTKNILKTFKYYIIYYIFQLIIFNLFDLISFYTLFIIIIINISSIILFKYLDLEINLKDIMDSDEIYEKNMKKIISLNKEINKIQESVTCLDNYIDNI